jgi:hypothetical protein
LYDDERESAFQHPIGLRIWPSYISDLLKRVDSLCKLIYKDAKKVEGNESNKESAMQPYILIKAVHGFHHLFSNGKQSIFN